MNIYSAEYFITLAEEKSFTRAAEKLHITQQSLSAHIAGLENELGAVLLVRKTPLRLTYAGEVYLRHALKIKEELDSLAREFGDLSGNHRGVIKIGVGFIRGRVLMPDIIEAFQKEYPGMSVRLTEGSNEMLIKWLKDGSVDCAVAHFDAEHPDLVTEPYYREEMVMTVARALLEKAGLGSPELVEEAFSRGDYSALERLPLIISGTGSGGEMFYRNILAQNNVDETQIRAYTGNVETQLALCRKGIGACFVQENLARVVLGDVPPDDIALIRFGETGALPISFAYLKKAYQWTVIRDWIRIAKMTLKGKEEK